MEYQIQIDSEAKLDIQEAVTWYNSQQKDLGRKFHIEIKEYFNYLKINPLYEIKYNTVRCLPLKKFPYTLHYTVNEIDKIVIVRAVYHTSRNPDIWENRIK